MESDAPVPDARDGTGPPPGGSAAGASRWERSFAEHTGGAGSSRTVSWVIAGVITVIILTFVLAAVL